MNQDSAPRAPAAQNWRQLLSSRFDSPGQAVMTRSFSQPFGRLIAAAAFRLGVDPNTLTYSGLLLMIAGSILYALSSASLGVGLAVWVIWQIGFGFDCADGQLARATSKSSPYGGWLDITCDYIRQSALALCLLSTLLQTGIQWPLVFGAVFILQAGQSTYLHAAATLSLTRAPAHPFTAGPAGWLSTSFKTILDTPLFLTLLCLLRPYELLLTGYCAAYGALLLLRGWVLGRYRIKRLVR